MAGKSVRNRVVRGCVCSAKSAPVLDSQSISARDDAPSARLAPDRAWEGPVGALAARAEAGFEEAAQRVYPYVPP